MDMTPEERMHFLLSLVPYLEERKYSGDYHAADTLHDVRDAIERADLTGRQRQVLELIFIRGLTQHQCADILEVGRSTIRDHENAVIRKVAEAYERGEAKA